MTNEEQQTIPSNLFEVALTGAALSLAMCGEESIEVALRASSRLHARDDFSARIAERRSEIGGLSFDAVKERAVVAGFPDAALRDQGRLVDLLARAEVGFEIIREEAAA